MINYGYGYDLFFIEWETKFDLEDCRDNIVMVIRWNR
jgi:hypothetical protein